MLQCTNTIYINNLNEKIKIIELKKALQAVFSQFGGIVDIHVKRNLKMRGQAFIAFQKKEGANAAVHSMQGFPFFDKPLKIQFARVDSDSIAKHLGTYVKREKEMCSNRIFEKKECIKKEIGIPCGRNIQKKVQQASFSKANQPDLVPSLNICSVTMNQPKGSTLLPPLTPTSVELPSNNILFLTNLPPDTNQMLLSSLFGRFPGFREIRTVPGRPQIAFAEFFDEKSADFAKNALQGCKLSPTHSINISFAKK